MAEAVAEPAAANGWELLSVVVADMPDMPEMPGMTEPGIAGLCAVGPDGEIGGAVVADGAVIVDGMVGTDEDQVAEVYRIYPLHNGVDEDRGWQSRALCAQTDPESFFPEKGGSTREAKKICLNCEVRSDCLSYALANDERFGIWGGLSERERRRLKRAAG
jgi:WhiB family transcriptional regulator, redox-sensing transcriptional regulator